MALGVAENTYGYFVQIWFPVCPRSVYGKWGNSFLYGDEPFQMPDWNGPETAKGEDRADEKFLPEERKLITDPSAPGYYAPDWEGQAVVTGLDQTVNTYGDWSGDPYTRDEVFLYVPSTLTTGTIPVNSKIVVEVLDHETLHFTSKAPEKPAGGWKPYVAKIPLQAAEHV